jgi:hypothetical protein
VRPIYGELAGRVYCPLKDLERRPSEGDGSIVCLAGARTQAPSPMPTVPEAKDDVRMEAPPGDLPTGETLPKAG